MGNFVSAIEKSTNEIMQITSGLFHDVGNNPVRSILAGAGVCGFGVAALAARKGMGLSTFIGFAPAAVGTAAAFCTGPIALGVIAAAIGAGIVGGIVWYMRCHDRCIDFRRGLHEKKLDFLYDNLTQIKEMFDKSKDHQVAVQALQQIGAEYREFSELFHVFHLAIDANFRCVGCGSQLENILQICLCQTNKYPREMLRWTCHCLSECHSCCTLGPIRINVI